MFKRILPILLTLVFWGVCNVADAETEIEDNGTFRTATPINLSENLFGYTNTYSDKDYYSFTLDKPGNLEVYSENGVSIGVSLYDINGQLLGSFTTEQDDIGGKSVNVGLPKGDYYILVSPDDYYKQNYELDLTFTESNYYERELNGTLRTATKLTDLNSTYKGFTQFTNDIDYYTFTLNEEGIITLSMDNGTDIYVSLYNSNNESLMNFSTDNDALGTESREIGLAPGTYFIKITPDDYYREQYSLKVSFQKTNYNEKESNNTLRTAKAIELNKKYNGYTQFTNDRDIFSFNLEKSETVTIKSNHGSDLYIRLMNQFENTLTYFYTEYEKSGVAYVQLKLPAGKYFISISPDDYYLQRYEITISIPTALSVNNVSDKSTYITGKTDPRATLEVKYGSKLLGKVIADSKGNYKVKVKKQKAGTKLKVRAKDKVKDVKQLTVIVKDKTAPTLLKVNNVSDKTTYITGKTEAKATVEVKYGKKLLGKTSADNKGNYKVKIKKKQKNGTKLKVIAKDKAKNTRQLTVTVKDKTALKLLKVNNVSDKTTYITGKTDPKAIIEVKYGKNLLGKTSADNKGYYKVKIKKKQKAGTKLKVIAKDKAKNKKQLSVTVKDKTAPIIQKINKVTSKTRYIKGKTEALASVKVKRGSKLIGHATADTKGNFKLKINSQIKGTKLKIVVQDKEKNYRTVTIKIK